jgi:hypothetical protein
MNYWGSVWAHCTQMEDPSPRRFDKAACQDGGWRPGCLDQTLCLGGIGGVPYKHSQTRNHRTVSSPVVAKGIRCVSPLCWDVWHLLGQATNKPASLAIWMTMALFGSLLLGKEIGSQWVRLSWSPKSGFQNQCSWQELSKEVITKVRTSIASKRTIILKIGCDLQAAENVICLTKPRTEAQHACQESFVQYLPGVETWVNMIRVDHLLGEAIKYRVQPSSKTSPFVDVVNLKHPLQWTSTSDKEDLNQVLKSITAPRFTVSTMWQNQIAYSVVLL